MVNEKPSTQFYALRITLYAFNPQPATHNPILRFTRYASNQFRG